MQVLGAFVCCNPMKGSHAAEIDSCCPERRLSFVEVRQLVHGKNVHHGPDDIVAVESRDRQAPRCSTLSKAAAKTTTLGPHRWASGDDEISWKLNALSTASGCRPEDLWLRDDGSPRVVSVPLQLVAKTSRMEMPRQVRRMRSFEGFHESGVGLGIRSDVGRQRFEWSEPLPVDASESDDSENEVLDFMAFETWRAHDKAAAPTRGSVARFFVT
mmetsp:Transcript_82986/g.231558  ORF Transcript_82986/g.231558 Transcript_82986/m.231558 type:complete len:214 (+) Transcript_82986:62-703(+)